MVNLKLSLVLFIAVTAAYEPCVPRDYGLGTIVCVCNATYCDSAEPTTREDLSGGNLRHYVSNKEGKRLDAMTMHFTKEQLSTENATVVKISYGSKYQEIYGFGGAMTDAAGITIMSLSEGAQDLLLRQYFAPDGLNYNFIRVPIGGSDFSTHYYAYDNNTADEKLQNFDLSEEDYVYKIPLIKRAQKLRPEKINIFAAPWSAPEWMKQSPDNGKHTSLKPEYYQLWADYYVKFLDSYSSNEIDLWAISTQNEPSHGRIISTQFNSMGWTSTQQREWLVGNLGPTLIKNGYENLKIIILDDDRNFVREWSEIFYQNDTASRYVSGMGIHWYLDFAAPISYLDDVHEQYPDKFLLYTEACYGDDASLGDWIGGQQYISSIIKVINHYVNGWVDWNLALDLEGGPNWVDNFVNSPIIINSRADEFYKQPMFYALAHVAQFVAPGSVRVVLDVENDNGLETVAFLTPDNIIVLVVFNNNDKEYNLVITDPDNGNANVSISANSMNTLLYVVDALS